MGRILAGAFGFGSPNSQLSSPSQVIGDTKAEGGVYYMHEGDLFTPGTGNWVLDATFETPTDTIWGHAFLRTPNTFKVSQPPQVYSNPTVVTDGLGGPLAGQIILQPLMEPAPEQGG